MNRELVNQILTEENISYSNMDYVYELADKLQALHNLCRDNNQLELMELFNVDDFEDFITIYRLYERIKGE